MLVSRGIKLLLQVSHRLLRRLLTPRDLSGPVSYLTPGQGHGRVRTPTCFEGTL